MTCPNCTCRKCRAAPKSPLANLPGWEIAERAVAQQEFDEALRNAFSLQPKYTFPTDPDAEQLAGQVGELASELRRAAG